MFACGGLQLHLQQLQPFLELGVETKGGKRAKFSSLLTELLRKSPTIHRVQVLKLRPKNVSRSEVACIAQPRSHLPQTSHEEQRDT